MSRLRERNTIVTTGNAINLSPGDVLLVQQTFHFEQGPATIRFQGPRLTINFVLQAF